MLSHIIIGTHTNIVDIINDISYTIRHLITYM